MEIHSIDAFLYMVFRRRLLLDLLELRKSRGARVYERRQLSRLARAVYHLRTCLVSPRKLERVVDRYNKSVSFFKIKGRQERPFISKI